MPGIHNRVYKGDDFLVACGCDPVMSFDEIGKELGISRQLAQLVYRKALWKLRRWAMINDNDSEVRA